jgi:hypothetical protein
MILFAQQQDVKDSHSDYILDYRSEVALSKPDVKTRCQNQNFIGTTGSFHTFFAMFCRNDGFQNTFVLNNIGQKDTSMSLLSSNENCRSLADFVLELFKKQWRTLYLEMGNSNYNHFSTTTTTSTER